VRIIVIIGRLLLIIHFGENESSFLGICGFFEGVFRGYHLSIMEMQIECQDILIEQIARDRLELFWDN